MKQQHANALVASILLMILTFGMTIFGGIVAGLITDKGGQLYFTFFALTWFWCGTLMLMVSYRIFSINPAQINNNNIHCFKNWRVFFCSIFFSHDFQFQKYVSNCLILILFHTTLSLQIQSSTNPYILNGLQECISLYIKIDTMSFKVAFLISLVFGAIIQLSLGFTLIQILVAYKGYRERILYQFHVKETIEKEIKYKKSIAFKSILFCILSSLYYVLKIISYSMILNIFDKDKNIKVFATIVMIQSLFCIFLYAKIMRQLIKMCKNIATIRDPQTMQCFVGWGAVIKVLMFQKKNYLLLTVILLFLVIQVIYGLISYPFYQLYSMPLLNISSEILYIYFDTATLTFFLIWRFIDIVGSYYHKEFVNQVANPLDSRNTLAQIAPQEAFSGNLVTHQRSEIMRLSIVFGQEEVASEDFGDCCICLDKMKEEQQIYRLKCHSCHVFHYNCIMQWMISHNHCPLCQQAIY